MEFVYMPQVIAGEYIEEYKISVVFSNGKSATIDFSPFIYGPIFEPLRDIEYFKNLIVDGWTISWKNGADVAPETLYDFVEPNEKDVA